MAKQGIAVRDTAHYAANQGARAVEAKAQRDARAARRAAYEGETFVGMTPVQKDALLRDIAIELGLISE